MKLHEISKSICILLAIVILISGCASSTLLQTTPPNAQVYANGQRLGNTPYTYSDRKIAGASTLLTFKKEGYEDYNTTLRKIERLNFLALFPGIFFVYPLFWVMGYDREHSYYLDKVEEIDEALPSEDLVGHEAVNQPETDKNQNKLEKTTQLVSDYNLELIKGTEQNQRVKNFLARGETEKAISYTEKQTGIDLLACNFTLAEYYMENGDLSLAEDYFKLSGNEKAGFLKIAEYLSKGEVIDSTMIINEDKIKMYLGKVYDEENRIIAQMAYYFDENVNALKKRLALTESMNEVGISSMSSNGKMIDIPALYEITKMQTEVYSDAASRMYEELEKMKKVEELKKEFADLNNENSTVAEKNSQTEPENVNKEEDKSLPQPVPEKKKSNSLFPEGEELITLLSATISPETITTSGSVISIKFKNNESISTDKLIPVVVFVTNSVTITTRTFSGNIFNSDNIAFKVSNPASTPGAYGFYDPNAGQLSGSGTIYCYLEDSGNATDKNDSKRVSNVLSIYATFK